jgi:hypothetical protein
LYSSGLKPAAAATLNLNPIFDVVSVSSFRPPKHNTPNPKYIVCFATAKSSDNLP